MSRSLNKVTLIGNLGNDPEVRSTTGWKPRRDLLARDQPIVERRSRGRSRKRRSGIAASCGTRTARSSPTSSRST